jgi:hypothetical protein
MFRLKPSPAGRMPLFPTRGCLPKNEGGTCEYPHTCPLRSALSFTLLIARSAQDWSVAMLHIYRLWPLLGMLNAVTDQCAIGKV